MKDATEEILEYHESKNTEIVRSSGFNILDKKAISIIKKPNFLPNSID